MPLPHSETGAVSATRRRVLIGTVLVVLGLAGAGLYVANDAETLLSLAIRKERSAAALEERSLTLLRHDIVYLDGGDPSGDPILLIHGFSADKDNWTRMNRFLADAGFRVIAPDLPGHGQSSRLPDHQYSIPNQVAFVQAFVTSLDLPPVHVIGNSMGGHIAGGFAALHPELVRSVALLAASGVTAPEKAERFVIMEETGTNPLLVEDVEDFDRLLGFLFVEKPPMPGVVKQYFADHAVANRAFNDKIYADLLAPDSLLPLEPLLPRITMPALILWGDTDRALHPSGAEVFAAGLPHAERVTMTACGHSPMIERPEETARHYLAFLAGVDD